jgi:hypothetical protein
MLHVQVRAVKRLFIIIIRLIDHENDHGCVLTCILYVQSASDKYLQHEFALDIKKIIITIIICITWRCIL